MARQQLMLWKMFVPCVTKIRKSLGVSAGLVYVSLSLCALGLHACFFTKDKLKGNEAYPHKLVGARMRILLTFFLLAMSLEL